jgi:type IV pilus assembly protein PilM
MKSTLFYRDKPIFGIDIGNNNLRIMQVATDASVPRVLAYGKTSFSPEIMKDGVIVDPASLAEATNKLMTSGMHGKLTTHRVALAIPSARSFSRAIKLPHLDEKDIADAVRLEAEQYIPVNIDKLYLDHTVISRTPKDTELFAVAAPQAIVDSYIEYAHALGLDPVIVETSIHAATRLFQHTDTSKVATVIVDFGSASADITIVDKTIIATGTVTGGGDSFIDRLVKTLGVTKEEAHILLFQDGLRHSKQQSEIETAIAPALEELYKEIRRMIRYYEERYASQRKINQIVLMGSANFPGLSEKMTDELRIPVRNTDPWDHFSFDGIDPLEQPDHSTYVTVAGLAITNPAEIFA